MNKRIKKTELADIKTLYKKWIEEKPSYSFKTYLPIKLQHKLTTAADKLNQPYMTLDMNKTYERIYYDKKNKQNKTRIIQR